MANSFSKKLPENYISKLLPCTPRSIPRISPLFNLALLAQTGKFANCVLEILVARTNFPEWPLAPLFGPHLFHFLIEIATENMYQYLKVEYLVIFINDISRDFFAKYFAKYRIPRGILAPLVLLGC